MSPLNPYLLLPAEDHVLVADRARRVVDAADEAVQPDAVAPELQKGQ